MSVCDQGRAYVKLPVRFQSFLRLLWNLVLVLRPAAGSIQESPTVCLCGGIEVFEVHFLASCNLSLDPRLDHRLALAFAILICLLPRALPSHAAILGLWNDTQAILRDVQQLIVVFIVAVATVEVQQGSWDETFWA